MSPIMRRAATAIFDANPFERRFRDVNTVTQQVQGRRSHFETIGQYLLGASPACGGCRLRVSADSETP